MLKSPWATTQRTVKLTLLTWTTVLLIYFPGDMLHIAEGLSRPTHYLFSLPHRVPAPLSTIKKNATICFPFKVSSESTA